MAWHHMVTESSPQGLNQSKARHYKAEQVAAMILLASVHVSIRHVTAWHDMLL